MSKPDVDVDQCAFPSDYFGAPGMTLRDYFAAKAMQAIITNPETFRALPSGTTAQAMAKLSYEVADTMLAERAK